MSVTSKPKAPNHSIYLGAPISAPSSMKSKSRTRFKAAITTTPNENNIPKLELLWINGICTPNNPRIKLIIYTKKIPPVAAAIPSLKFSVGLISPDR